MAACAFTARYVAHVDQEERELEPLIRHVLTGEEAMEFGRRSVERTSPVDQRMMLGWVLPAMTRADAAAFLGRLPSGLATELRALAET